MAHRAYGVLGAEHAFDQPGLPSVLPVEPARQHRDVRDRERHHQDAEERAPAQQPLGGQQLDQGGDPDADHPELREEHHLGHDLGEDGDLGLLHEHELQSAEHQRGQDRHDDRDQPDAQGAPVALQLLTGPAPQVPGADPRHEEPRDQERAGRDVAER